MRWRFDVPCKEVQTSESGLAVSEVNLAAPDTVIIWILVITCSSPALTHSMEHTGSLAWHACVDRLNLTVIFSQYYL